MTDNTSNLTKTNKNGFNRDSETTGTITIANENQDTSEVVTPTQLNMGNSRNQETLVPHQAASVDQLQEHKAWMQQNKGEILASMLREIPMPVTRKVTWGEFVNLFGLTYEPDDKTAKVVGGVEATFHDWVRKFNFSYMALTQAATKINSNASEFDAGLNKIADHVVNTEASRTENSFRKLFD